MRKRSLLLRMFDFELLIFRKAVVPQVEITANLYGKITNIRLIESQALELQIRSYDSQ